MEFLRPKDVMAKMKLCRASLYHLIREGLFPRPVKLGDRVSVWADDEVEKVMSALYQKMNNEDLKEFVLGIEKSRRNGFTALPRPDSPPMPASSSFSRR